jgi:nicotinamidase-related amidase
MPRARFTPEESVLFVIDIQGALLPSIHEIDRVVSRTAFLIKIAKLLGVPIVTTEQNPGRMGGTEVSLASLLDEPISKMAFSACGCHDVTSQLKRLNRKQAVLTGIETHICVSQTAHDLLEQDFTVGVCPDAVSARSLERHKLGMERIRDAGAIPAHTESIAYEWLKSADHPLFREALKIVKEHP